MAGWLLAGWLAAGWLAGWLADWLAAHPLFYTACVYTQLQL